MADPAPIDPAATHETASHKHGRPLVACAWDPAGKWIAFSAEDATVHRLTAAMGAAADLPGPAHDSWPWALRFSPDGTRLFSGGYDGRLVAWSLGEPAATAWLVTAHDGWLRGLAVSPDGTTVATCGNDRTVKLWRGADGGALATCPGHESHVYAVAWHPDGQRLVSCDLKGFLKEWDAAGAPVRDLGRAEALWKYDTQFRADIGGARTLAFRADGAQLAVGGITAVTNAFAGIGHPAVCLLGHADGTQALLLEPKEKQQGVCWGVAWHPQGFWVSVAGGGGGGWLRFFKPGEAGEFHALKLPANGRGLALSPDGRQVAVALADGTLRTYGLFAKTA